MSSPDEFDLAEFLEVIGRAKTAITIHEVLAAMPKQPPSVDECTLQHEHYKLKVKLLTRQLQDAHTKEQRWAWDLHKAQQREKKIKESQF